MKRIHQIIFKTTLYLPILTGLILTSCVNSNQENQAITESNRTKYNFNID